MAARHEERYSETCISTYFLGFEGLSNIGVGVAKGAVFKEKRPGAGFKTGVFIVKKTLGGMPENDSTDFNNNNITHYTYERALLVLQYSTLPLQYSTLPLQYSTLPLQYSTLPLRWTLKKLATIVCPKLQQQQQQQQTLQ